MSPGVAWQLAKRTLAAYMEDNALSRGAAIAFYAVTALGPILLIIVAVVGLGYGHAAARGALLDKLQAFMGTRTAAFLQDAIKGARHSTTGVVATIIGVVSLLLTATGVFGEMQAALNVIWRAQPKGGTVRQLIRSRLASLALVAMLALVLIVSLVISAVIAALQHQFGRLMPAPALLIEVLNLVVSLLLLSAAIAAVFKVLPDRDLAWQDVAAGAVVTALLISLGKLALGVYIGSSATISGYGAAGSVLATLFWIYYSVQIFLLGAEFTRVYAERQDALRHSPGGSTPPSGRGSAAPDRPSPQAG